MFTHSSITSIFSPVSLSLSLTLSLPHFDTSTHTEQLITADTWAEPFQPQTQLLQNKFRQDKQNKKISFCLLCEYANHVWLYKRGWFPSQGRHSLFHQSVPQIFFQCKWDKAVNKLAGESGHGVWIRVRAAVDVMPKPGSAVTDDYFYLKSPQAEQPATQPAALLPSGTQETHRSARIKPGNILHLSKPTIVPWC